MTPLESRHILGMRIDGTSYADASARVLAWARAGERKLVYVANVHMIMEGHDDAAFRTLINAGDLVTSDGMPLVWMLRALGVKGQTRVYGPDLTLHICEAAAREGVRIGFMGGRPEVLAPLERNLEERFPGLQIAYMHSPPFRPMSAGEAAEIAADVKAAGVQILFVGLGCPKQEHWIAANAQHFDCPLLGVGAAFDFHAGQVRQAPSLLQQAGLEWLFRLAVEPRRLWRRYVYNNPRFVVLAAAQLLRTRPLLQPTDRIDRPA